MRFSFALVALLSVAAVLAAPLGVHGQDASAQPDPAQIGQDEVRLEGLEGEITSINDRLAQLEQQSASARQQRDQAARRAADLAAASRALLPKIELQAAKVVQKRAALKEAIAQDYQRRQPGAVMMLAESGSVSDTMVRAKYRNVVTERVDQLAQEAKEAEDQLRRQKGTYDDQKRDLELAQRQIDEVSASITAQESESKELLANRSNEAAYVSDRLERAKAMQQQLLDASGGNAIWGTFTEGAHVTAGSVIGFEGSTGNSTGCHTHFSVIRNGSWVNPQPYLDSGLLAKPNGSVTQGYGMTAWARSGAYGGAIHNGIDFVQPCGAAVRAAADGTVIRDIRNDGSGFGHYVMIRHKDGLITLYGHLV